MTENPMVLGLSHLCEQDLKVPTQNEIAPQDHAVLAESQYQPGSPAEVPTRLAHEASVGARFWTRVDVNGPVLSEELGACWEWTAHRNHQGYGKVWLHRTVTLAQRAAYLLFVGEIPAGQVVRHRCHNRPCVRPSHLQLGTVQDNANDMVEAGRSLLGVRNHNAKLSDEDVVLMREARAQGSSAKWLAEHFAVTDALVSQICTGKGWRHVGGPITPSIRAQAVSL